MTGTTTENSPNAQPETPAEAAKERKWLRVVFVIGLGLATFGLIAPFVSGRVSDWVTSLTKDVSVAPLTETADSGGPKPLLTKVVTSGPTSELATNTPGVDDPGNNKAPKATTAPTGESVELGTNTPPVEESVTAAPEPTQTPTNNWLKGWWESLGEIQAKTASGQALTASDLAALEGITKTQAEILKVASTTNERLDKLAELVKEQNKLNKEMIEAIKEALQNQSLSLDLRQKLEVQQQNLTAATPTDQPVETSTAIGTGLVFSPTGIGAPSLRP